MKLEDRVAIVTGGARGIGRAICERFAAEGAHVAVVDLDLDAARETSERLCGMGAEAVAVRADVTRRDEVQAMVGEVMEQFGRIDILVNNAGWDRIELFLDSREETWEKILAVNLKSVLYTCHAVLPHMVARSYGKVVNIGSDAARVGSTGEAVYAAAKGGVIAFSKTIAREMAKHRINVNVVCPGPARTPLFQEIAGQNDKLASALERAIPFRRLAEPEEIASAVAFLASDDARFITGQTLSVSGGLTMA
ncbi:glucose 1-dehydrogenase [Alicyclobacillus mali]|uniref:Glucose 1-dehydrogenase n=1 Tax=Alicyclobacillus mali (ex Roth et al. 2021) TaxID=1123961 RepID=A0ABS0F2I2_9BACL|nr:SDR family NAD(P)-dependent oxidoreductase [Alicyclobacillus mali (ex Roth et al. 2021)]MBF8377505.1 glucose 1-dehydrogenase [Alicyclobacillus mali (ex Roth et al. 2021)]